MFKMMYGCGKIGLPGLDPNQVDDVWKCTTSENLYRKGVLIGNWNEERFDIKLQQRAKRLPSDVDHYYESTYYDAYNIKCVTRPPIGAQRLMKRQPRAYNTQQPELDMPYMQGLYNSWETTSGTAFVDPKIHVNPSLLYAKVKPPPEKHAESPCVPPPVKCYMP